MSRFGLKITFIYEHVQMCNFLIGEPFNTYLALIWWVLNKVECGNFLVSFVPTSWNIRWIPVGRQYCEKQYFKLIEIFKCNQTSNSNSDYPVTGQQVWTKTVTIGCVKFEKIQFFHIFPFLWQNWSKL